MVDVKTQSAFWIQQIKIDIFKTLQSHACKLRGNCGSETWFAQESQEGRTLTWVCLHAFIYSTGVHRQKQSDMPRTKHTKAYRQKVGKKDDEKEDVMVKQVTDATWTERIVWFFLLREGWYLSMRPGNDDVVCLHWLTGFNPFGSKLPLEVGSGMSWHVVFAYYRWSFLKRDKDGILLNVSAGRSRTLIFEIFEGHLLRTRSGLVGHVSETRSREHAVMMPPKNVEITVLYHIYIARYPSTTKNCHYTTHGCALAPLLQWFSQLRDRPWFETSKNLGPSKHEQNQLANKESATFVNQGISSLLIFWKLRCKKRDDSWICWLLFCMYVFWFVLQAVCR